MKLPSNLIVKIQHVFTERLLQCLALCWVLEMAEVNKTRQAPAREAFSFRRRGVCVGGANPFYPRARHAARKSKGPRPREVK